ALAQDVQRHLGGALSAADEQDSVAVDVARLLQIAAGVEDAAAEQGGGEGGDRRGGPDAEDEVVGPPGAVLGVDHEALAVVVDAADLDAEVDGRAAARGPG